MKGRRPDGEVLLGPLSPLLHIVIRERRSRSGKEEEKRRRGRKRGENGWVGGWMRCDAMETRGRSLSKVLVYQSSPR